tara:strand:+ start:1945 stop:2514 length:570 start_codon:yes stop_codon:yes gene_type:complete
MAQQAKVDLYTGTELISLQEAKDYLRVATNDDDSYITELIKIARMQVLKDTNQVVVDTTITEYYRDWPENDVLCLSYAGKINNPIIKYADANNVSQSLTDQTDYKISYNHGLPVVQFYNTFTMYDRANALSIQYDVEPQNADVVRTLKIAMYMLIQHFYDNRSPVSYLKVDEMPLGYKHIITQYKNYIW